MYFQMRPHKVFVRQTMRETEREKKTIREMVLVVHMRFDFNFVYFDWKRIEVNLLLSVNRRKVNSEIADAWNAKPRLQCVFRRKFNRMTLIFLAAAAFLFSDAGFFKSLLKQNYYNGATHRFICANSRGKKWQKQKTAQIHSICLF